MYRRLGSGDDVVNGTEQRDIIDGLLRSEGADGTELDFSGGFDRLVLGGGRDVVYLYTDAAEVSTGTGNDTVHVWFADGDRKVVRAGAGDDLLDIRNYGASTARISGDAGNDTFLYRVASQSVGLVIMDGGDGADRLLVAANGTASAVEVKNIQIISTGGLVLADDIRISAALLNDFADVSSADGAVHRVTIDSNDDVRIRFADAALVMGTGHGLHLDLTDSAAGVTVDIGRSADDRSRIIGGDGNDVITLRNARDYAFGGAGDDAIRGSGGLDRLHGGDGQDFIGGGADGDQVYGENGADTLNGDAGNDFLSGGADDDVLNGGTGRDTLDGGTANDVIYGGDDDDRLLAGAGADLLSGDLGNDRAYGQDGNDTLDGGDGDDALTGGAGDDFLIGGNGADTLSGRDGDEGQNVDTLVGGSGADTFFGDGHDLISYAGSAAAVTVNLATGAASGGDASGDVFASTFQYISGSDHDDVLTGNNFLSAGRIDGGAGNDTLYGGDGPDYILGGDGNDFIDSDPYSDWYNDGTYVDGGSGDDMIVGYAFPIRNLDVSRDDYGIYHYDEIVGGDGYDTVDFSADTVQTHFNNSYPSDDFDDYADMTISGVEYVIASRFSDSVTLEASMVRFDGGDGDDKVAGSAADQAINGQAGDDTLAGGDGNDTLAGGTGSNRYDGGSGNDVFLIGGAGPVGDTIADFTGGQDRIDLTFYQTSFAQLAVTAVDADGDGAIDDVSIAVGHGTDSLQLTLVDTAAATILATDFIF